jgi:hypothetical protein
VAIVSGDLAELGALRQESGSGADTIRGAGIGVAGTLIGGVAAEFFARKREKRAQSSMWNASLFARYEAAYRLFLSTWAGSPSADTLRESFRRLRGEAFVPEHLVAAVDRTLTTLTESGDALRRRDAAQRLQAEFGRVLGDPEGFTTGGVFKSR